ncbi:MAG: choice-of-anchor R domain-containing protein, partial [Terrimicrobiaceae bacterium]
TAATVVSNLGNPSSDSLPVCWIDFGIFYQGYFRASSFTTGSSETELNSVTVSMENAPFPSDGFEVSVYDDSGYGPGSLLASLTGTDNPATAGAYTYTAGSPLALTANTTYFVVASVPQSGVVQRNFYWSYTETNSVTSAEGWTIGNYSWLSDTGGASWMLNNIFGTSAGQFSVDTTVVPEPSTALLLVGGLSGLLLRRRK